MIPLTTFLKQKFKWPDLVLGVTFPDVVEYELGKRSVIETRSFKLVILTLSFICNSLDLGLSCIADFIFFLNQ